MLLCGVLLLFLSVEVVHVHPAGGVPDLGHCAFCMGAHLVPQPAAGFAAAVLFAAVGRVAEEQARTGYKRVSSQLRIRPPPALPDSSQDI